MKTALLPLLEHCMNESGSHFFHDFKLVHFSHGGRLVTHGDALWKTYSDKSRNKREQKSWIEHKMALIEYLMDVMQNYHARLSEESIRYVENDPESVAAREGDRTL